MSGRDLYIGTYDGHLTAAIVTRGVFDDLYLDTAERKTCWASFYICKVQKIDKKLNAAIIDLGSGFTGILPAKYVFIPGRNKQATTIADLLSPGETVQVQIKSEAREKTLHENYKIPRLTMRVCLIGQYVNYHPHGSHGTGQSEFLSDAAKESLAALRAPGGWVAQTNCERADASDIAHEAQSHLNLWADMKKEIASGGDAPRLIRAGLNAFEQALQDYGAKSFDHIFCGDKKILDGMIAWCKRHQPDLATSKRLRLFKPDKPGETIFDAQDVAGQIADLAEKTVHLPGGGTIIIEPTHAVIMIDVNQGAGDAQMTNTEAAREIARQVRLRNLSGAILVDFINMTQKTDRAQLFDLCGDVFSNDHSGAEVHGFTRLGIMEITRKRRSAALAEKLRK
jgi:ribonuclease E/ribonuclease G